MGKLILSVSLITSLVFGGYSLASAEDEVLDNTKTKEEITTGGKIVKVDLGDTYQYNYIYDDTLSEEENRELQMKLVSDEIRKTMCEETGCDPNSFKPIDDKDVIDSGIINENGSTSIKDLQ